MGNRHHKLSVILLKYIPIVGGIVMWLHTAELLLNVGHYMAEYTFSISIFPWLVCFVWSKTFGFCKMHRAYITYIMIISYWNKIQSDIGFGSLLIYMRLLMFLLGLSLLIWFIIRVYKYKYHCLKA